MPIIRLCTVAFLVVLAGAPGALAQSGCGAAIAEFRTIVEADAKTGNLNKSVAGRLLPEIDRVAATCRSGKDADAVRTLQALKGRYGYH
jgi:hypothetical protein